MVAVVAVVAVVVLVVVAVVCDVYITLPDKRSIFYEQVFANASNNSDMV